MDEPGCNPTVRSAVVRYGPCTAPAAGAPATIAPAKSTVAQCPSTASRKPARGVPARHRSTPECVATDDPPAVVSHNLAEGARTANCHAVIIDSCRDRPALQMVLSVLTGCLYRSRGGKRSGKPGIMINVGFGRRGRATGQNCKYR